MGFGIGRPHVPHQSQFSLDSISNFPTPLALFFVDEDFAILKGVLVGGGGQRRGSGVSILVFVYAN